MSKFQKNLEDSQKSSTFAPGFVNMRRACYRVHPAHLLSLR